MKADPNLKCHKGLTPTHYLFQSNSIDKKLIELFQSNGADFLQKTNDGQDGLSFLLKNGFLFNFHDFVDKNFSTCYSYMVFLFHVKEMGLKDISEMPNMKPFVEEYLNSNYFIFK